MAKVVDIRHEEVHDRRVITKFKEWAIGSTKHKTKKRKSRK